MCDTRSYYNITKICVLIKCRWKYKKVLLLISYIKKKHSPYNYHLLYEYKMTLFQLKKINIHMYISENNKYTKTNNLFAMLGIST